MFNIFVTWENEDRWKSLFDKDNFGDELFEIFENKRNNMKIGI